MDTHTDTATLEAPAAEVEATDPVSELPQETAQDSFIDALDAALSNITESPLDAVQVEEPATEEKATEEKTTEEKTTEEKTTEEKATEEKEKLNADDPIEDLSGDIGEEWTPKAASRFKQLKDELKNNKSELDTLRQTVREQESKMEELNAIANNRDVDSLKNQLLILKIRLNIKKRYQTHYLV